MEQNLQFLSRNKHTHKESCEKSIFSDTLSNICVTYVRIFYRYFLLAENTRQINCSDLFV